MTPQWFFIDSIHPVVPIRNGFSVSESSSNFDVQNTIASSSIALGVDPIPGNE